MANRGKGWKSAAVFKVDSLSATGAGEEERPNLNFDSRGGGKGKGVTEMGKSGEGECEELLGGKRRCVAFAKKY